MIPSRFLGFVGKLLIGFGAVLFVGLTAWTTAGVRALRDTGTMPEAVARSVDLAPLPLVACLFFVALGIALVGKSREAERAC